MIQYFRRNLPPILFFSLLFVGSAVFHFLQGTATVVIGGGATLTGCTNPTNGIDCTGDISSDGAIIGSTVSAGDGTSPSALILPELTANGLNDTRIYGASSQSADGCIVWPTGNPTSGQVAADAGSSTSLDGKTCRVFGWTTPAAGGGTTMGTGSWLDPITFSFLSTSNYTTAPSNANDVFLTKFQAPYDITVSKVSFPVHTNGDYIQIGIYNAACNSKLGSTTPLAHATVSDLATFASPVALTGGTVYYLATTTDGTTSTGWSPIFDNGFGYLQAALKQNSSNFVQIAGNPSTGSTSSLALPATCGSNADGDFLYTWAMRLWK